MSDTAFERDLIRSARLQFSPETQSVKATAVDRIVEHSIGLYGDDGLTVGGIVQSSTVTVGENVEVPVVRHADVIESVNRLTVAGRISTNSQDSNTYCLTDQARSEMEKIRRESSERAARIVTYLFEDKLSSPIGMINPFFELLGRVFSKLGSSYVGVLRGDTSIVNVNSGALLSAVSTVASRHHIDEKLLRNSAIRFFEANDPDSVATKWNLAQNYYVSLALGLDPSGALLGEDLFGSCVLYLDTNVVIPGVEKSSPQHESFHALVRACKRMGVSIRVWGGTLRELNRVTDFHIDVIERTADKIPTETESKVRGIFYEKFRNETRRQDGEVNVRDLFSNFHDARIELQNSYEIEIEDDPIDVEEDREKRLENDLESIVETYTQRKGRKKSRLSAIHDATLVEKASTNTTHPSRCLVVTLDRIMPMIRLTGRPDLNVTVALDAFLQWISPFAGIQQSEDDLPETFSRALASRILPDDGFFEIEDFLVFAAIDYDTRLLPAEDVENCILHLRKVAPGLNPLAPQDREVLHGKIARFFANPGREYHKKMNQMKAQIEEILGNAEESTKAAEESKKALHEKLEGSRNRTQELQKELHEERARSNRERIERESQDLRRSARVRLAVVAILWGFQLAAILLGASSWGLGENFYQLLIHSWPALAATPFITSVLAYFVLGKKRRSMLKPLLRGVFRMES